jgi:hypothetical protein
MDIFVLKMQTNAMSGTGSFYNYFFYRIQKFYQKIGAGKGSGFYAWLILSMLECLNILTIFYILILTSTINVQKLGSLKLYSTCLLCLLLNALYFFWQGKRQKATDPFKSIPQKTGKRWKVLLSIYIVTSLVAFIVLMIMVRIHLQDFQPKSQNLLPFPMRQK